MCEIREQEECIMLIQLSFNQRVSVTRGNESYLYMHKPLDQEMWD